MKFSICIVFGLLLFCGSCTIEKRQYRPGFSFQWKHKPKSDTKNFEAETNANDFSSTIDKEIILQDDQVNFIPCDTIKLMNGSILSVKITNYNPNKVTYMDCEKKSGQKTVINASEVEYLKKEDGTIVEMTSKNPKGRLTTAVYIAIIGALIALACIFLQWWIPSVIFVTLTGNFSWFGLVQMYNRNNKLGMAIMVVIWMGTLFAAIIGMINLIHMFV